MGELYGNYWFEHLVSDVNSLENRPGVYLILNGEDHSKVIDVGSSKSVKDRIRTHDRRQQWKRYAHSFAYAVKYCDAEQIVGIENRVRDSVNPPCGDR